MEILTPKVTRRSTRIRVEIPVSVTSLDRQRPFAEKCSVLIVSAQGCGFRSSRALQMETPIMMSDLPGGGSVTGRVANCLPLGNDGKYFLIGVALYTHGNVWGIADPPEDWNVAADSSPAPTAAKSDTESLPKLSVNKRVWPYNLFSEGVEAHPGRK
ncbi:MAG: PilZ domain-containing protein [Candidatus Sulfotelmatobacter sp.]